MTDNSHKVPGTVYEGDLQIDTDESIGGIVNGQVVVGTSARATISGIVNKGVIVTAGGDAEILGIVNGLLVEQGGTARIGGIVNGRVENLGSLHIDGIVNGHLVTHPGATTTESPHAIIAEDRT